MITIERSVIQRIAQDVEDRQDGLVREANHRGIWFLEDEGYPNQYLAYEQGAPGRCEIVTPRSCSCRRFRFWKRCPHQALLITLLGTRRDNR
jgi:hypothetical protein